jgi:hypothetical protein
MREILKYILDWSEVWALLLPMGVLAFFKPETQKLKPVVVFVLGSFLLYFLIDFSWKFKESLNLPRIFHDNRVLYNISSILRTVCFLAFFMKLKLPFRGKNPRVLPVLFLLFVLLNFIFLESFMLFGNYLHLTESIILLVYCLSYYLRILKSDQANVFHTPEFWIITGLTLYEAVNLPIFMNYENISESMKKFAIDLWSVHNVVFIVMCIFLAKGFYQSARNRRSI